MSMSKVEELHELLDEAEEELVLAENRLGVATDDLVIAEHRVSALRVKLSEAGR